ncbi:aminotransferase class V-fold PLP-dependent enzyme [Fodinibius saliphilus]|uniref:aminotransferase class V-fold PLP-dependent enzyme n=1 Tax=Fodinibius saliphilus TaxID=1920650 RepID=UPI001107D202|nr:aminotransferase class V-fold PLP-dependent enzyme [Fodinibius saliphilus]
MDTIDQLATKLTPYYLHFNVENRLLFTGHSHQAWPDIALEGLKESFTTAASQVDNKWDPAFEKAEILRNYLRKYYDDPDGLYSLAENTHLLLVAWLSSFDLKNKPKVITTTGEFHSMFRQLHRLKEEGLEVIKVDPYEDIVSHIIEQIDDQVSAIMLSRVYFKSGLVNQHISEIAALARSKGIPLLIDDYHGTNVIPLSITEENLEDCYLLIGGYKYLQWGEGNCFLRFPKGCELRPAITGWFASFSTLDEPRNDEPVHYDDGNQRFASGTYDPASQFRAAKVVEFFEKQGLTADLLRQQYQRQVGLLRTLFLEQDFDPEIITLYHNRPLKENGGFLALRSPYARTIRAKLMEQDVFTDARGDIIRFGAAPYITSEQINQAIGKLADVVGKLNP